MGEWRSPQNVRQEAKWRGSSLNCPIPATGAPFSSSGFGTQGMSPWCCWQSVSFPSEAPAQAMLPWHCCEAHMVWYIPTRASLLAEGWRSSGIIPTQSQRTGGWKTQPGASGMETHPPSLPYQTPFLCWHPATTCTPLQPAWDDPLIPLYSRGKAVKVRLTPSEPQFLKHPWARAKVTLPL